MGLLPLFTIILTTGSHFSTQEYIVNKVGKLESIKHESKYALSQVGQAS